VGIVPAGAGPRPCALPVRPDNIPRELKALNRWLVWGYRWNAGKGKWDKPPCNLKGRTIDGTSPKNWFTFEAALAGAAALTSGPFHLDGVGLAMADDDIEDALVAVDIDHCRNPETSEIDQQAAEVVSRFDTYTELSPSATGLRLFCRGRLSLPAGKHGTRVGPIEVYRKGHYLTVTGQHLEGTPEMVEKRDDALRWLLERLAVRKSKVQEEELGLPDFSDLDRFGQDARPERFRGYAPGGSLSDDDVIRRAQMATNGDKFTRLWSGDTSEYGDDHSRADLALANMLAYWCDGDAARVERLFGQSQLGQREKWTGRADYRERTIAEALKGTSGHSGNGQPHHEGKGQSTAEPAEPGKPGIPAHLLEKLNATITIGDLAHHLCSIAWLWKLWIQPGQLTAVTSKAGKGKTRFCMDLLRRIRSGLPWPCGQDMTLPTDAPVIWVPADRNHRQIQDTCDAFGIPRTSIILNADSTEMFGGTQMDDLETLRLLDLRVERYQPSLVVVDTLSHATRKDLFKVEDTNAVLRPLADIAQQRKTAILLLAHLNTQGETYGQRLDAWARQVIRITEPDPGAEDRRCVEVTKSDSERPRPLGITISSRGYEYDTSPPEASSAQPRKSSKQAEAEDWLCERLADGQPQHQKELVDAAEAAGISKGTLFRAARELKLIEGTTPYGRGTRKTWALPDPCEGQVQEEELPS
jgi:hypothetical protein